MPLERWGFPGSLDTNLGSSGSTRQVSQHISTDFTEDVAIFHLSDLFHRGVVSGCSTGSAQDTSRTTSFFVQISDRRAGTESQNFLLPELVGIVPSRTLRYQGRTHRSRQMDLCQLS